MGHHYVRCSKERGRGKLRRKDEYEEDINKMDKKSESNTQTNNSQKNVRIITERLEKKHVTKTVDC